MIHVTLNTRDSRVSPRDEVSPSVRAMLRPLLADGLHPLPGPLGYDLAITTIGAALIATVYRRNDNAPLVMIGVAADFSGSPELWAALVDLLASAPAASVHGADAPLERPTETPWCGAVVLFPTRREAEWLGDFERCLAWAWVDLVEASR